MVDYAELIHPHVVMAHRVLHQAQAAPGNLVDISEDDRATEADWLGNLDSNQDKQSQSLLCYRYTIPQRST